MNAMNLKTMYDNLYQTLWFATDDVARLIKYCPEEKSLPIIYNKLVEIGNKIQELYKNIDAEQDAK